jgi:hypothetical protein
MERGCQFKIGQVAHLWIGRGSKLVQVGSRTMVPVLAELSSGQKCVFLWLSY